MNRNTLNYILENVREGLQKQIVTKLPISLEIKLAICLYKLTREDYYYTIGEVVALVKSTVCRINKKKFCFLKLNFLNIRFQSTVTIPWKNLNKFESNSEFQFELKRLYKSVPSFSELSN